MIRPRCVDATLHVGSSGYRATAGATRFDDMKNLPLTTDPQKWIVDPMHTTLMFSVRHLMIATVHGVFESLRGIARYDALRPELTKVAIDVPVASIQTRQAQRDAHLLNADFFDADRYPTIAFRSTRIGVVGGQIRDIAGALTIRGITRELVLAVDEISGEQLDHNGRVKIGASATARILRSEFGMTYNRALETGGFAVGDEVKLRFDLSLFKELEHDQPLRSILTSDGRAQPG
jgi:polyisoprenoid-binding protein YceI